MPESAAEVADRLQAVAHDRVASQALLASLFAESVQLYHEPERPTDGPIAGNLIADIARRETEAMGRALSSSLEVRSDVTVEDDTIRMQGEVAGTLSDGTPVAMHTDVFFRVAGGKIVGLRSNMDEASMATWGQLLTAGGFELPG